MENIDLLGKAKQDMIADMQARGIGAIIWDNATVDFDNIPEINLADDPDAQPDVARVMGLYPYEGTLYAIEEGKADVDFNDFYDADSEVKPTVVTLSESVAKGDLGNPSEKKGYTTEGSLEEWLTIADCYFAALNEAYEEDPAD